ncbi:unnamed protein product [Sordaria macrospora k-hell]|uniref:WGS project CABT00000000 data, contig 2.1 n=1 Tax=Sordaria macrospora (strain ATCC MYA-333 / DSM 997 / K(L3346) / K-hell) TaxID=771870 RepID=F7VKV3_SORMK|nr:uncharacterized protein SMAC_12711 [Sordaria macrospora k-hell]CCC06130.1 unnamed protein product [Sordaria macrospora k-hell]
MARTPYHTSTSELKDLGNYGGLSRPAKARLERITHYTNFTS